MIIIGYQGIKDSNSEAAAIALAIKNNFTNTRFVPLVSSFNVLDCLTQEIIDYGVIAMYNNTGGHVKESEKALEYIGAEYFDEVTLPISHYLFVKNSNISKGLIKGIVSHTQALIQCRNSLKAKYPDVMLTKDEDTATAAMKLRLDLLPDNCAVLCREEAGSYNGLCLLESHLEDRSDNTTTFHMYKKTSL